MGESESNIAPTTPVLKRTKKWGSFCIKEVPLQEIHILPTLICQKSKKTTKMWLIHKTKEHTQIFPFIIIQPAGILCVRLIHASMCNQWVQTNQ